MQRCDVAARRTGAAMWYRCSNSSMTWKVQLTGPAQKEFARLPPKDAARVKAALVAMEQDPFQGDIKRLKGQLRAWRRRVGSYRIIYDLYLEERLLVVMGIVRRTSTTY
ncbi:MAG: type II toxin-antitoxin system RelE/ParE family toxin [Candidatus Acidiferrales bacterium]